MTVHDATCSRTSTAVGGRQITLSEAWKRAESQRRSEEPWIYMDKHDSHLDVILHKDGVTVTGMNENGFQYLYKGIRANYGIRAGVYMYEVKVLEHQAVTMPGIEAHQQHMLKCGFSHPLSPLFLGDNGEGCGYGGNFSVGDVIGCVIDMHQDHISFFKNGKFTGVAFKYVSSAASGRGFPTFADEKCQVSGEFLASAQMV